MRRLAVWLVMCVCMREFEMNDIGFCITGLTCVCCSCNGCLPLSDITNQATKPRTCTVGWSVSTIQVREAGYTCFGLVELISKQM